LRVSSVSRMLFSAPVANETNALVSVQRSRPGKSSKSARQPPTVAQQDTRGSARPQPRHATLRTTTSTDSRPDRTQLANLLVSPAFPVMYRHDANLGQPISREERLAITAAFFNSEGGM